MGGIKYYATRIEFQFCGKPHTHSFLSILNPVKLIKETINEYVAFLDRTIQSFLPDQIINKHLYDLVELYRTDQHPTPCRKYNNTGHFFTDRTIVAVPLDQSVDILEKSKNLIKRNNILSKVKQYMDEFLDPSKASYLDNLTVNEAFKSLNIVEVDYYDVLSLSPTSNSCFTNNYNPIMLKAWGANVDLITIRLFSTCPPISQYQNWKFHKQAAEYNH